MVAYHPSAPFQAPIVGALEEWYRRATREQRRRGREWYPTARQLLEAIAADTGYSLNQAVAVMAITSPGAQLVTNLAWTRAALESRGRAKVGRFPNVMRPKVASVLANPATADEFVTGPKVGPFYRAILGDTDALVLDRWALGAAFPASDRETVHKHLTRESRAAVEAAYRALARRKRLGVSTLQAIVWLAIRESTPNGSHGTVHRLADITA